MGGRSGSGSDYKIIAAVWSKAAQDDIVIHVEIKSRPAQESFPGLKLFQPRLRRTHRRCGIIRSDKHLPAADRGRFVRGKKRAAGSRGSRLWEGGFAASAVLFLTLLYVVVT